MKIDVNLSQKCMAVLRSWRNEHLSFSNLLGWFWHFCQFMSMSLILNGVTIRSDQIDERVSSHQSVLPCPDWGEMGEEWVPASWFRYDGSGRTWLSLWAFKKPTRRTSIT